MLLELTTLALELVEDIAITAKEADQKDTEQAEQPQQNHLVVVIELDHMRDRKRYMDTLR